MKPPVGVEVGMDCDELLLKSDGTDQVEKKCLAGAVLPNDEPKRRATVSNAIDILDKSAQFLRPSHLDKVLAYAGHDARAKGLQDSIAFTRSNESHYSAFSRMFCCT